LTKAPLTVAALQLPHRFGDVAGNLTLVDKLLSGCTGIELALLPELALTGYVSPTGDFDLSRFAESVVGRTREHLSRLATKHRVHVAAPLVEREGAALFNTLLLFNPAGELAGHYRKRFPWYPEQWATPGDLGTPLFEISGWKMAPAICFDIHFVSEVARAQLNAADALLFPSAWVEESAEEDSRRAILSSLAQQFDLPIVNANWGDGTPRIPGQGSSRIVDRTGAEITRAHSAGPTVIVATLSSS
jgi:predicted amidohydrolase